MPLVQDTTTICDGCGGTIDTDVHPRVIINDANQVGDLYFCTYACLGLYAAAKHETHEAVRLEHLAVTIEQLNATLARAHELETAAERAGSAPPVRKEAKVRGEYETVASVPLHPLVELVDGDPPTVRAKAAA